MEEEEEEDGEREREKKNFDEEWWCLWMAHTGDGAADMGKVTMG